MLAAAKNLLAGDCPEDLALSDALPEIDSTDATAAALEETANTQLRLL
ncbi:hypothetical protein [Leptolyngbya sp. O-77]|nr:hypothetical protein [Leptolyngbya sp. O-77]